MAEPYEHLTKSSSSNLVDVIEPIAKVDLTDEVLRRFKLLLERKTIKPGDKLPPERELATLLGISRPSLRHALKALQLMGTIESKRGCGTFLRESSERVLKEPLNFVVLFDSISIDDLFEVRSVMEVELAALAAQRAQRAELNAIKQCLDRQRTSLHDWEAFLKEDIEFHSLIGRAAHNTLFRVLMDSLRRLIADKLEAMFQSRGHEPRTTGWTEHLAIWKNLEAQDASGAREAMLKHLTRVYTEWLHGQQQQLG